MTSLVSWNTDATIEALHWLGYEGIRQGNLILLPVGVLGMEEACSGIRSLQGGLMVALFFGEYFRLSPMRRILLLLVAILAAMMGNLVRSSLLAVVASARGMAVVTSWHDPAGFLVLLITVVSVAGCSLLWRKKENLIAAVPNGKEAGLFPRPFPLSASVLGVLSAVTVILLFSFIGTEYWFRSHEHTLSVAPEWDLSPRSGNEVMSIPIPSATLNLLFNPKGFSEKWQRKGAEMGQVFYFRWPPGRIAVQSILAMHNPSVCLSNIGMNMKAQLSPVTVEVDGIFLQFHSWLFEQNGHSIYVFNAMPLNIQVPGEVLAGLDDSPRGRLKSLLAGLRNNGQRMIEIAFWNLPDETAARKALTLYLREAMVKPHAVFSMEKDKI